MASLECFNCKSGIYHTEELDGIEQNAFLVDEWKKLSVSETVISRYNLDGPENFIRFWACPKCGTMHMMVGRIPLIYRAYRPVSLSEKNKGMEGRKCIFFDDKTWFEITEHDLPADKLNELLPPKAVKYAIIGKTFMDIYQDEACTEMLASYELIPFDYAKPYKPYPAPWNEEM